MSNTKKSRFSTRDLTLTALLAAIAYLLAFIEFQVPLSPSFARMDCDDNSLYFLTAKGKSFYDRLV